MPAKLSGKNQDEKPPNTSLKDAFAKQGFVVEVHAKVSEGGQKPEESSWLADEENNLRGQQGQTRAES